LFHEKSFLFNDKSLLTEKGPFSPKIATSDEQPGPPVSQTTNGSLFMSFLDLKSQKNKSSSSFN
jgi:hypothetical protein